MQDKIHQCALNLLARRDHSEQELLHKLRAKNYADNDIQIVIERLKAASLINESQFIANYVDWRRKKGFGPIRIKLELKARGVSDDAIAEQLEITDNAWAKEAYRVWYKQFKGLKPRDVKSWGKQIRFLQYRGFTKEHINSILKENYGNDE